MIYEKKKTEFIKVSKAVNARTGKFTRTHHGSGYIEKKRAGREIRRTKE